MSAFIVDKSHIDAMVLLALNGPKEANPFQWQNNGFGWYSPTGKYTRVQFENADDIGRMLWRENVRSIHARYPDTLDGGDMPGPCDFTEVDAELYTYPAAFAYRAMAPVANRPTAVQGLKLIGCFEYQACETDDWRQTETFAFCHALKDYLISELPGYDAAPWEWEASIEAPTVIRLT